jgi:phosphoglycolate phosphatase
MTFPHVKHVLFDLDGTLVDSSETIAASVSFALGRLGEKKLASGEVTSLIGQPLLEIFGSHFSLSEEQTHRAIDLYREHYEELRQAGTRVYDGVREALSRLQGSGRDLYVATVKPTAIAETVLVDLDLRDHFKGVAGSSMDHRRRSKGRIIAHALASWDLVADASLMVGDRAQDIEGARENGFGAIGVNYGFGTRDELAGAGPLHIVDTAAEIANLLLD